MRKALLLVLNLAAAGVTAAPVSLPRVNVRFTFEATMYTSSADLSDGDRKDIADAAVAALITAAADTSHFPFIAWTKGENVPNTLAMTVKQRPDGRDQAVDLVYAGTAGGRSFDVTTVNLYLWTDGKHTADADGLKFDIVSKIKEHIEDLRSTFTNRVPLTSDVTVDGNQQVVLVRRVPPPSKLNVDEQRSQFTVHFTGLADQHESAMVLYRLDVQGVDKRSCRVQHFDFGGVRLDAPNDWSPRLPAVFSPSTVKITGVVFEPYRYKSYGNMTSDH